MQLSVSELLTSDAPPVSASQQEFSKLWKRIGTLKKRNANFSDKLQALAKETAPILRNYEEQSIIHMQALVAKKLHFLAMKSLGKYNRDDLSAWIEESLNVIYMLQPSDPKILKQLTKQFNEIMSNFYDLPKDLEAHDLATEKDNYDDEDAAPEQSDDSGFQENQHEHEQGEHFQQGSEKKPANKLRDLLENANISKMFRKIARVLHPDREQDPKLQLVKQELMAQAIQARDDGDIITLFDLYTTHVDKSEFYFDEEQLAAINALLKEQIKQLQQDKQKIIESSHLNYQCNEYFFASSAKKIQEKIKAFKKQTALEIDDLESLAYELKTLKIMKEVIGERNGTRFINPFDDLHEFYK